MKIGRSGPEVLWTVYCESVIIKKIEGNADFLSIVSLLQVYNKIKEKRNQKKTVFDQIHYA